MMKQSFNIVSPQGGGALDAIVRSLLIGSTLSAPEQVILRTVASEIAKELLEFDSSFRVTIESIPVDGFKIAFHSQYALQVMEVLQSTRSVAFLSFLSLEATKLIVTSGVNRISGY